MARGKLALLNGLAEKLIDDPGQVKERLDRCLLCGSCQANCPSGVKVLDLFLKARTILGGYLGLSPAKRLILRSILARPALFDLALSWGARFQGFVSKPVDGRTDVSCARTDRLFSGRHFHRLAEKPFHEDLPALNHGPGPDKPRAAFFTGCLIDRIYPRVGRAAVRVLNHFQVGLEIPVNQACCGIPALASGDMAVFERLLRHNLRRFNPRDFDYLLTACATCAYTIKKVWPLMSAKLPIDLREKTTALADRTRDIGQFLVEAGLLAQQNQDDGPPLKVTYHDPCHLKKSLQVAAQPRRVLTASAGCQLTEMAESDWCCGMGGSFNLEHYDLSSAIGQRKVENIKQTGCEILATGCPACMMQITDGLSRNKIDIKVRHFIEIYADGLGVLDNSADRNII